MTTSVELIDSTGNTVQTLAPSGGEARLCDFGFGVYSIDVARGLCGYITLHDIHVVYGRTRHFDVTLNRCPDEEMHLTGCYVYFRVQDGSGKKLENVAISSASWPKARTDEYGRARVPVVLKKTEIYTVKRDGYVPQSFEIQCKAPIELERQVILMKP